MFSRKYAIEHVEGVGYFALTRRFGPWRYIVPQEWGGGLMLAKSCTLCCLDRKSATNRIEKYITQYGNPQTTRTPYTPLHRGELTDATPH